MVRLKKSIIILPTNMTTRSEGERQVAEDMLMAFTEWKKSIPSQMRGDRLMYDVKGSHVYLTEEKLLDYYLTRIYFTPNQNEKK